MPVARYFLVVGGVLLALLFAVDAYVPKEPVVASTVAAALIENPTLRIRSDRKWPERVVYDTSLPTIVPPKTETAAVVTSVSIADPAPVAEVSAKAQVRESFAQLVSSEGRKPQPQVKPRRKIVRSRAAPPTTLVAQQPHFGFFANNIW